MSNASTEKAIFQAALFIADPAQLAEYLDVSCQDDAEMRRRVESLLAASEDPSFMSGQAMDSVLDSPKRALIRPTSPGLGEQPGDRVGNYKLLQQIGEGGFGVVYMAEQQEPIRRRVALKIIKLGMDTKQVVARFEAERQALAMMDHPNIAKVFEAGSTESGRPYFVMELVRGVAITKYCDEHDLTNTERLGLFVDACSAIQHAHQKGIIHRDVKPNNVMITLHDDRPVPKVIDFGIAKATEHRLTEKTLFTEYAQLIGTPAYMSPEQAQLSGLDIDTRSDIYSLGVLLYELLVGAPPFDPEQLRTCGYDEICRRIREVEPPIPSTRLSTLIGAQLSSVAAQRRSDPSKLMRQVRGDLDWIVMKALEKDRRRRYDTATALANDVQRFLQGEPVTAVSPSTVYKLRRFASRNQGAIAAMTFVLLSLILATTISTWQALRATQAKREKSQILLVAERARDEAMTKGKLAVQAAERAEAGELRAQHIAYASDMYGADLALRLNNLGLARRLLNRNRPSLRIGDFRNWEWRSLWMRCRERAVSVLGDRGPPVCSVSVSRDGHYVATGGFGNLVRVWRTSSGRIEKTLSEGISDQLGLVVFSPKGHRLYATAADGTVKAWSIPSFAELPLQLRHGSTIRTMSLSDDGKILAIFGFDEVVSVWDLANPGTPTRLDGGFAGERQWGALAISRDKRWLAIGLVGAIRIVNLETLDQKALLPTEGEAVKALTFSPDAEVLASASGLTAGTLDLWRVADGTRIDRLEGHSHYVYSLDYSPDGRQLASCGADQTVRLWDTKTRKERAVLRGHETEVWAIDIAAGAGQLVSGDKNGEIRIWNLDEHVNNEWPIALSDELPTGWHGLHSQASFSADGRRLATRNRDGSVSLRSAEDLQETHRLTSLGTENRGVRFAPRQRLLAVGDANGHLTLLDPDVPQEMKRIALNPSAEIFPTSFSREGDRLLAVARGGTQSHCVLISVADGQKVLAWSIPPDEECAALSPDGELVVTGHADGRVCFWQVGEVHEPVIRRYEQRIDAVAFSPDGELLLMAIGTGEVEVWDVAKGTSHGRLRGHMQGVHAVQFSPDGKRAATAGSWGESVKLWDLVTEQEVATLSAGGYGFRQVEFSPDGNAILTVNDPGSLHLWQVPSCEEILTAEDRRSFIDSAQE